MPSQRDLRFAALAREFEVDLGQLLHAVNNYQLAVMHQTVGTLDAIERLLSMTVYVHSAPDFTRQSEVADAASALFHDLLGTAGQHARSAVGVLQLPKNATVEIDLRAAIRRSN